MSDGLKIGIDVDGVLYDFVSAFRNLAVTTFDRDFPFFSSDWDFKNWGLTAPEYVYLWDKVKLSPDWFLKNEEPYYFSSESLQQLVGHDLYFITTRCSTEGQSILRQTQLQINRLGIEFPTVIVRKDKGPVVAGLSLDLYIDDYQENLIRVEECSPKTKLFLVSQTYNESLTLPEAWTRVGSIKDFVEGIQNASVAD